MDDRQLLDGLRRSDQSAFDALFRLWYARLVQVAESMTRERGPAEELVQDVMLNLWQARETLAEEQSLQAYLLQSTRNRALNHLRRRQVERRGEPHAAERSASAPRADALLLEEEIDVALNAAVRSLPDRCREVFELSRVQGLKYSEIASTLGISVKTVEAQMGKALRVLREQLAPWLPERR